MKKTRPKKEALSTLIKEADTQMSLFIRLSAADEKGMVMCVSCMTVLHWKEADCAHFVDRGHMATRYDLTNLAPACQDCNRFNPGEHKEEFRRHIINKYGTSAVIILEAGRHLMKKWMRHELEELIEKLKEEVKRLRKKF